MSFARTRYEVRASLGKGGMGKVFLAHDTLLNRAVALKVVAYDDAPDSGAATTQHLLREARLGAALKHPNVVTIYDLGEENGSAFIVMEFIEGQSLRALVGTTVPMAQKLRWLVQIASGLEAAHKRGLVHRDIKPENIMITSDGTAKVLDFGIAKLHEQRHSASMKSQGASSDPNTSAIKGTPRYMAPEQWCGTSDTRSDQYAWGVLAYELLSGVHPGLAVNHRSRRPLADFGVPAALSAAIDRTLSQLPDRRYPSFEQVLALFEAGTLEFSTGPRTPQSGEASIVSAVGPTLAVTQDASPGLLLATTVGTPIPVPETIQLPSAPESPKVEPTPLSLVAPPTIASPLRLRVAVAIGAGLLLVLVIGSVFVVRARSRARTPTTASISAPSASMPAETAGAVAPPITTSKAVDPISAVGEPNARVKATATVEPARPKAVLAVAANKAHPPAPAKSTSPAPSASASAGKRFYTVRE